MELSVQILGIYNIQRGKHEQCRTRPRGYKTFFMLNSAEHEICPANKSQITDNCKFFLAKPS